MQDKRIRILAVEDNPDTQLLLRYLLRPHYELEIVPRVDEAIRIASDNQYDFLLLDINLGEERTGIDLLNELRAMPAYTRTPAVALTAYAMPGDRERFVTSGFDGYISKPFTRKELFDAIRDALEASGAS
jgi:CheY-like chemotaxis protein